jgi:cytochrome c peroxidase
MMHQTGDAICPISLRCTPLTKIAQVALVPLGLALIACGSDGSGPAGASGTAPSLAEALNESSAGELGGNAETLLSSAEQQGRLLFERAFPRTNGRSCATCHVLSEATTLLPDSVAARLEQNPQDPLFQALDADDPDAEVLTFEHLKKGLVRVTLPLPDNMDLIDLDGNVITPEDRTLFVWRGVPSVADVVLTAPYQLDGRAATLEEQAQGAISSHSEGPIVPNRQLERIGDFEQAVFSNARARYVAKLIELGVAPKDIIPPELSMPLSSREARGRELFGQGCAPCHGGAGTNRIIDRDVHDLFFNKVNSEGNLIFETSDDHPPLTAPVPRPDNEFLNVGFGLASALAQIGQGTTFNQDVELPRYRFRFYTDGSREEQVTDLPPVPVTESGDLFDPNPALDDEGAPIVGPNRFPQLFSTDGGRALITGDPLDFEAFDVPSLRGIAATAPYYHDNSMETLEDVIDSYSRFVLGALPPLGLPPNNPPETPNTPPEALSPRQKVDLLAFLLRL